MSDTTTMNCKCCDIEDDCINGLCSCCQAYNEKIQKQIDLLTLGLLQEKRKITKVLNVIEHKMDKRSHQGHIHSHGGCLFCEIEQALKG